MLNILTTCLVLGAATFDAVGQNQHDAPTPRTPRTLDVTTNDSVPDGVELVENATYYTAVGQGLTPRPLTFDAAYPTTFEGERMPALIFMHGGGFVSGDKAQGRDFILSFAEGGYFAMSIEYRLATERPLPAATFDAAAALRYLRTHADELDIDPERIGLSGYSAGGHLATLLATRGDRRSETHVACAATIAAPTDLAELVRRDPTLEALIEAPEGKLDMVLKQLDPVTYIDANDPPIFLAHGEEDQTVEVEHMHRLARALESAGVPVTSQCLNGTGHIVLDPQVYQDVAAFFDLHLGGKAEACVQRRVTTRLQGALRSWIDDAPPDVADDSVTVDAPDTPPVL
ncbi:MAG: alpha/beta hydrolase [Planctomycetota bacterium]